MVLQQAANLCERVLSQPPHHARAMVQEALGGRASEVEASRIIDGLIAGTLNSAKLSVPANLELLAYLLTPYERKHGSAGDTIVFWPEDFISFFTDVAYEVGIDVERFGARLDHKTEHPQYTPGFAFRTLAEIAGIYVEYPNALTEFRVPRGFLVAMTAAIIGVATGKAATIDPTLAAAVGGIGSLLLNVLAQRYSQDPDPSTDWLEEFILQTLERHGRQSAHELHALTHIYKPLLQRALTGLAKKGLVEIHRTWEDGRRTFYDVRK